MLKTYTWLTFCVVMFDASKASILSNLEPFVAMLPVLYCCTILLQVQK